MSEVDDFLPISALEHLVYCERQCALIHVGGVWLENVHTTDGRLLHERVDSGETTTRPGLQVLRGVALRSTVLRLTGVADAVEVWTSGGQRGARPIEYKRGARRAWLHDEVQVAAQAMALEEMMGITVHEAAIFHGKSQRRRVVKIDQALRAETRQTAERLHALVAAREIPAPVLDRRCDACSLRAACGPDLALDAGALARALRGALS